MARVLVTGGAGFIGSNLAETLLKQGHWVRVFDNFSTGKEENLAFGEGQTFLEIIEGDIRDRTLCHQAMRGVEYVFHHAALPSVQQSVEDPLTSNSVNVEGTLNILLGARDAGVKRLIYASSCAVYGDDPILPKREEMAPAPLSPYALQKYMGEEYCRLFFRLYGLETVSLRYFNVFGPKQDPNSVYSAVVPKFIDALIHGRSPVVFGDGEQSRDFIYVENVVQANLLAMSAGHLQGQVINIGQGKRTSLNQLVDLLKEALGSKVTPVYEGPREGDVRDSFADIEKGLKVLNYLPHVEIGKGLGKTIAYFQKLKGSER